MAKLGIYKIAGNSGMVYEFAVYPLNTVWAPLGGIFIITHRDVQTGSAAEHIPLKLGHLANLQELENAAVEWHGHRGNCICLLREKDEARRELIAADIAAAIPFPM
jgi:hypothetical protein